MGKVHQRLVIVAILMLRPSSSTFGQPPAATNNTIPEVNRPVLTDLYGDPLPPGALARMGTVQLRGCSSGTAFSPDGRVLAMGDQRSLRLWSMTTGKLLLKINESDDFSLAMYSPDGKWLATVVRQSISLRDAASGQPTRKIPAANARVLAFSLDSKLLATTGPERTISLWNTTTGQLAFQLRDPKQEWVDAAAFTPDARALVSLGGSNQGRGKKVCHWDLATKAVRKAVELPLLVRVFPPLWRTICLSPDGQTVAAAPYSSKAVVLFDTATGKERIKLQGDSAGAHRLAFTPDSRILATTWVEPGAPEGSLSLWDAATGKRLRRFPIPAREVLFLRFAPDGRTILTDHMEARVRLWNTATGQPLWQRAAHDAEVWSLCFTPDGRRLVSGARDETIRVWDVATGRQARLLGGHSGNINAIAVLPDGKSILSSGGDSFLRLQDLNTGRELRRFLIGDQQKNLTQPSHHIECIGLGGHGRTVAALSYSTMGKGSELHVWDLSSGQLSLHRATIAEAHFRSLSPGAKLMVGFTETVRQSKKTAKGPGGTSGEVVSGTTAAVIRKVSTGRELVTIPQPDSFCFCHAFSPDGQTLATVTSRSVQEGDGYRVDRHAIHFWELTTGRERLTIMNDNNGFQFDYERIAFAPDGRTLVTARRDHRLQLWEVATGRELLRRAGYDADVLSLAFSSSGKTLATGHSDSTILLWDLTPDQLRKEHPNRPLGAQELAAAWTDLASPDARKAHTAIWKLAAAPRQAVPFLRDRLHRAEAVPANRLRELVKDLDSSQFRRREQAGRQLAEFEEQAEPALQDAMKGNLPAEQRRRIEALLNAPRVVRSPEKLRYLRALQVLEQCTLPEVRPILETLAKGAPEARLTRESKAALQRLAKRPAARP